MQIKKLIYSTPKLNMNVLAHHLANPKDAALALFWASECNRATKSQRYAVAKITDKEHPKCGELIVVNTEVKGGVPPYAEIA